MPADELFEEALCPVVAEAVFSKSSFDHNVFRHLKTNFEQCCGIHVVADTFAGRYTFLTQHGVNAHAASHYAIVCQGKAWSLHPAHHHLAAIIDGYYESLINPLLLKTSSNGVVDNSELKAKNGRKRAARQQVLEWKRLAELVRRSLPHCVNQFVRP